MSLLRSFFYGVMLSAATLVNAEELPMRINCVNINDDLNLISELTDSGVLRFESKKFRLPRFNYDGELPYQEYLEFARNKILANNPKAEMFCPIETNTSKLLYPGIDLDLQQVVDLVSPFELKNEKSNKVVLLIHGLTDSPFLFHDLAYEFYQQGFSVRTLLLPGHGTAPSALIDTSEREWRKATKYAINQALGDFDQVYLGGFSTGGALILDQLSHGKWSQSQLNKIEGVMLWAPASKAKSEAAWMAKYVDMIPYLDWVNKGADIDFAKYESFPFNAAAQVHKLMNRINGEEKSLKNIPDIPLFVVASEVDQTINTKSTLSILNQWHQSGNRQTKSNDILIYYGDKSRLESLPKSLATSIPECKSQQLCDKVLDVAHNAATNSPKNPHYGYRGNYKYCEHHIGSEAFSACKSMPVVPTGEITSKNLDKNGVLRRLTFNPYFQHMNQELKSFIENTQGSINN